MEAVPAVKTWTRVGYSIVLSGTGTTRSTKLILYVGDQKVAESVVDGAYFFRDFTSANTLFLMGSESLQNPVKNFVGQVAEVNFYNAQSAPATAVSCPLGVPRAVRAACV